MPKQESFPKFFDLEGIPVRQESAERRPEVYRGAGKWETYFDSARLLSAGQPATRARFDRLMAAVDAEVGTATRA